MHIGRGIELNITMEQVVEYGDVQGHQTTQAGVGVHVDEDLGWHIWCMVHGVVYGARGTGHGARGTVNVAVGTARVNGKLFMVDGGVRGDRQCHLWPRLP